LLRREPDPDDLRNRIVTLTAGGSSFLTACRHDIRVMESDLLATLTKSDQAAFIRSLVTLAEATDHRSSRGHEPAAALCGRLALPVEGDGLPESPGLGFHARCGL